MLTTELLISRALARVWKTRNVTSRAEARAWRQAATQAQKADLLLDLVLAMTAFPEDANDVGRPSQSQIAER